MGVQILCGPSAHIAWCCRRHAGRGVWGHAPPENFEKLKPLRRNFHDSDSCKRLSIYLLNRYFSLIILLIYPFLNLPCLRLNYIWERNSSCYHVKSDWNLKLSSHDLHERTGMGGFVGRTAFCLQVPVSQILRNATSFIIFSKELKFMCCVVIIYIQTIGSAKPKTFSKKTNLLNYNCKSVE